MAQRRPRKPSPGSLAFDLWDLDAALDFSITNAALVIGGLLMLDRISDYLAWKFPRSKRVSQSVSVILVNDGKMVDKAMKANNLGADDDQVANS